MKKELHEVQTAAAALYDGGWRSIDKEMMMAEYGMDEEYADQICKELDCCEQRSSGGR